MRDSFSMRAKYETGNVYLYAKDFIISWALSLLYYSNHNKFSECDMYL